MLYFLGFLFLFLQPSSQNEIINQSEIYLNDIREKQNSDLNFWALNEIYSSNCQVNRSVSRAIIQSNLKEIRPIFEELSCASGEEDIHKLKRLSEYALKSGSFEIASHYLSLIDPGNKKNRFLDDFKTNWLSGLSTFEIGILEKVYFKERIEINSELTSYPLLVYSLIFSDFVTDFFNKKDLPTLISLLEEQEKREKLSLKKSLFNYSRLKSAYEINQFNYIASLYTFLINDNYHPMSIRQIGILSGVDFALSVTGNFSESLTLQRNILLPQSDYYEQVLRKEYILLQQSANLYDLGKFEQAKVILESIYNNTDSGIPKAQLFNNLALCYKQLGENNNYTSFLLRALQDLENSDSPDYRITLGIYKNLFVYYNDIGDSTRALPFIDKAKNLASSQNDIFELGSIHYYLGEYYWENFKNHEKALEEFERASSKFRDSDSYRSEKLLVGKVAKVLVDIERFKVAIENIEEMKSLAKENSDTPLLIEALMFEAQIASMEDKVSELGAIIEHIKSYSLDELKFQDLIKYHNLKAEYLSKSGKAREAYHYFKPIIEQIVDRAQGTVESESGFWTVEQEYLDAFEIMVSLLQKIKRPEEALIYLDKLKTINDASLFNNPLLKANKLTEKELADEKKLTAKIQELRSDYLGATGERKTALNTEIDRLSAERQDLVNKVYKARGKKDLPFWKIQNQIQKDELVIHFTQLNKQLFVFRITKHNLNYSILDVGEDNQKLLTDAAIGLASGKTSLNDLYKVYSFLKLDSIPNFVKQITVIPDNEFYRLPIEVLPSKLPNNEYSFGSTKYLIEDYSFKYFTSLQDFAVNNRNTSSTLSNDFSAFAISYFDSFTEKELPSLPYATLEATAINERLNAFNNKKVYSGNMATGEAFQNQLNNSKIIHVATHSEVSTQDPLFSTIYLKSTSSDGYKGQALYAYELFNNQLNNELIMLNSCSSGSGNYMQGTGIMGISRALRYAGAKSLGLNLWEVNDKIAYQFSSNFYEYLNKGLSKSEAMQKSKIDQIKTGSADPHYWGAYTIIGNVDPVIKKPATSELVLPLILITSLLAGYRVRKKIK